MFPDFVPTSEETALSVILNIVPIGGVDVDWVWETPDAETSDSPADEAGVSDGAVTDGSSLAGKSPKNPPLFEFSLSPFFLAKKMIIPTIIKIDTTAIIKFFFVNKFCMFYFGIDSFLSQQI